MPDIKKDKEHRKVHTNPDIGNGEYGTEFFNHATTTGNPGETVLEAKDLSTSDYEIPFPYYSFDEITDGFIDNMGEEEINDQLKLFRKFAKKLNCQEDDLFMVALSYGYDDDGNAIQPSEFLDGGEIVAEGSTLFTTADGISVIEEYLQGNIFLWFDSEDSAISYFKQVQGISDDSNETKEINLREALNSLDKATNNHYDLRNTYDSLNITPAAKHRIAELLIRKTKPEKIARYLDLL